MTKGCLWRDSLHLTFAQPGIVCRVPRMGCTTVQGKGHHNCMIPSKDSILGEELRRRMAEERVLVVGAGGIGCEVLKNLVLSGFHRIDLVDMDVIELSNLNRQFLFHRQHIGQPKAKVAAEALSSKAEITPHWANITDMHRFPLAFFSRFSLVLNALDNLDARRHVNAMCLAAGVPLVESGTAGYLGQSTVIIGGRSECFECTAKEPPKTFPICTIRTTPSAPIHCIVWAKEHLLPSLVGPAQQEDVPLSTEGVDEGTLASLKREMEGFALLRELASKDPQKYCLQVATKIFCKDIDALLELSELWERRMRPQPLRLDAELIDKSVPEMHDQHQAWPVETWLALFFNSLERLRRRAFDGATFCEQHFDKDDEDAMDFVAAAANLRAHIFGIPLKSRFTLKSMAGNIIPAIATTNAIVAGMVVLQAMNVLQGHLNACSTAFVTFGMRRGALFAREPLSPPNPDCAMCQVDRAIVTISHPNRVTLEELIERLVRNLSKARGVEIDMEDLLVMEGARILYDECIPEMAKRTLEELKCGESTFLTFDFGEEHCRLVAVLQIKEDLEETIKVELRLLPQEPSAGKRKRPLSDGQGEEGQSRGEPLEEPPLPKTKMIRLVELDDNDLQDLIIL